MFITFYLSLKEGDYCMVKQPQHPYCGRIVRFKQMEYVMQHPLYVFETCYRERVVASCESHFMTLPYRESLKYAIDLALSTRDEAWFHELVHQMHHASQEEQMSIRI